MFIYILFVTLCVCLSSLVSFPLPATQNIDSICLKFELETNSNNYIDRSDRHIVEPRMADQYRHFNWIIIHFEVACMYIKSDFNPSTKLELQKHTLLCELGLTMARI